MDEQTHIKLEKILATIKKRQATFGRAQVGLALSRNDKNELKLCFGKIDFLRKGVALPEEVTYDYGNFILVKKLIEVQAAITFIRSIFEDQMLKLNDLLEIPLKASLQVSSFLPSRGHYGYVSSEWPIQYHWIGIDESTRGLIPYDSLSKIGLPLFPSGTEAIKIFLGLRDFEENDFLTVSIIDYRIELLVPDYRARIKNLRLVGNRVTIEVETLESDSKNVLAKFYCKGKKDGYNSEDLPINDGRVDFEIPEEPFLVEAHILSALDGECIDKRKFDYRYPREEGVIIENIEAQLLETIEKGENVTVEFKRIIEKNEDFLETVVAFANTNGGTIFIGVDDNCRITGFRIDRNTIENLIASHCDPSIEVKFEEVSLKGIPITIVNVPEGTNKPYTLKDRGIFIRRGSSDRQIKRTELDEIYAKKTGAP